MDKKNQYDLRVLYELISSGNASKEDELNFARWLKQLDVETNKSSPERIEERRVQFQEYFHETFLRSPEKTSRRMFWLPVAAAAVVLMLTIGWLLFPVHHAEKSYPYKTAMTGIGQRKMIILADGSKVTLNNASQIRFLQGFPADTREVILEGEAFFEVTPDPSKPFVVKTGDMRINVLGTSFNVCSYAADQTNQITVATGKIKVGLTAGNETWTLTPGEQLTIHTASGESVRGITNPADFTGWKTGELVFRNQPLENICKRLERWYGVTISIKNPELKSKRINLKQRHESLETVLDLLGKVGSFQYAIEGNRIKIW